MTDTKSITLLNGRVKLNVTAGDFQPGLDSVMLAAACPAKRGHHVLDLGCGIGSAGLCLAARVPDIHLSGIDVQPHMIERAKENAALNNIENVTFTNACISAYLTPENGTPQFDHIICNPPFLQNGNHIPSPHQSRAIANAHMDETSLSDWIKAAFNLLKSGGSFTIIHRADHLDQIIAALGKSFGATEIIPLWPKSGVQAKRVIIRTIKHRQSPATIHYGLVLHKSDGEYTIEANDILNGETGLFTST